MDTPQHDEYKDPYKRALLRRVINTKSRDEAQIIIEGHIPGHREIFEDFLKTKEGPPIQPYVPTFKLLPWHIPREVQNWFEGAMSSINGTRGGRPSSLVLIGPPQCEKTTFALTFGRPGIMTGRWDVDELLRPEMTHLVLKNVHLEDFPCKRQLAGCQMSLFVHDKDGEGKNVAFGRPVIWVCTPEMSPLNDPEIGPYMRDPNSGVVVVDVETKLYR